MPLKNFLATLQTLIAETPFVNSTSIFYEERPPTAANDPAARNLSTYPSHKHIPQGILEAQQPSLGQVLQKIVSKLKIP
jgi:hypothetical protein